MLQVQIGQVCLILKQSHEPPPTMNKFRFLLLTYSLNYESWKECLQEGAIVDFSFEWSKRLFQGEW